MGAGRRRVLGVALALVAVAPLLLSPFWLTLATSVGVLALAALGLSVVLGRAGLLDLGHAAYFGLSSYATVLWARETGGSLVVGVLLGVVVATLAAPVVWVLLRRTTGLAFGLGTLTVAVVLQAAAGGIEVLGRNLGTTGPTRVLGGRTELTPEGTYVVVLAVLVLCALAAARLPRSRLGRSLALARSSPKAASASGVEVDRCRFEVFVAGAAVTGAAGALSAVSLRFADPSSLGAAQSIQLLTVAVIGGTTSALGPVLGALVVRGLPEAIQPLSRYEVLFTGVAFLLVLLRFPDGLAGALRRLVAGASGGPGGAAPEPVPAVPVLPRVVGAPGPDAAPPDGEPPLLDVHGVVKHFGSVRAVDGVSFRLRAGEAHGLVGANGSGKSTTLDLLAGVLVPDAGVVRWAGERIGDASPATLACRGLARTFQQGGLAPDLTLRDNVLVGTCAWTRGGLAAAVLPGVGAADERDAAEAADAALAAVGLAGAGAALPAQVGAGAVRLAEVARCLAARPRLVVLDEPAAGLDAGEVARLRDVLVALRRADVALLLVEHDLDLVAAVCERVTVLADGRVVEAGTAAELRSRAPGGDG